MPLHHRNNNKTGLTIKRLNATFHGSASTSQIAFGIFTLRLTFRDRGMENLSPALLRVVIKPSPVTASPGHLAAGADGKSIEASDLHSRRLNQLTVRSNNDQILWHPPEQLQCICVFVSVRLFKKAVCSGDQEKVNYLLVLRCRLASPGWVGSSGVRARSGMTEKGEKKERESLRLA